MYMRFKFKLKFVIRETFNLSDFLQTFVLKQAIIFYSYVEIALRVYCYQTTSHKQNFWNNAATPDADTFTNTFLPKFEKHDIEFFKKFDLDNESISSYISQILEIPYYSLCLKLMQLNVALIALKYDI